MTDTGQNASPKDRLVSRPGDPLPTPLPPDAPEARGAPADPKLVPATGQGDPDATDPAPTDIGRSA
jgi:hypothetical protein